MTENFTKLEFNHIVFPVSIKTIFHDIGKYLHIQSFVWDVITHPCQTPMAIIKSHKKSWV